MAEGVENFSLILGILIFFIGGLLFGGIKGWTVSFLVGGCVFMMSADLGRAIVSEEQITRNAGKEFTPCVLFARTEKRAAVLASAARFSKEG